ncbi:terminase small subunit [Pseudomonas psychrophila]|uniref:Terminase small subunit n=1 Tax=Pseudomonas psychrophila TaxID=122355 RepID=A0A8I1FWN2_9PSED|nr:terminase small subunit [Pseudomonas psychrophila]MBJ2258311.1 terminase small subunit [Pseudomonas psychrophila]
MTVISKTEFAARRGWAKSYVSKLANQDRLVLTEDGKVELEATEALLAESADPSKVAVTARHQQDRIQRGVRSQLSPEVEPTSTAAPQPAISPASKLPDFQKARAHREYYLAQLAEAEFHKVQGSQVQLEAVKTGAFNAGRLLRDQLLGMPPQLAPELAAMTDPWEIERRLTDAIRASLEDAERMSTADLITALNYKS